MFLSRRFLFGFFLCATLIACASARVIQQNTVTVSPTRAVVRATPSVPPNPMPIEAPQAPAVADLFAELTSDTTPGGAVGVFEKGRLVFSAGYGLANLDHKSVITPRHIFHLGSVGKQFTALGLMLLHEDGQLDYDAPIGRYLPELNWTGSALTVRHLLHHTSGLPDYDEDEDLYDKLLSVSAQPTNMDLLTVLANFDTLTNPPGEVFSYSNTGYDVLGALIERLSGQTYAEFMQARVFGLTGMTDTFALPDPQRLQNPRVCISYDENSQPHEYTELDNLNGSGSIYSTISDLFLYDQALYTHALVRQDTLAEAFTAGKLNNGTSTDYGFAWDVNKYKGEPYVGHGGAWLNFTSYFLRFPERQLSVVILLNRDDIEIDTLVFQVADLWLKR
jgi:CubicO group peptidase (beta-lactamase class C family)